MIEKLKEIRKHIIYKMRLIKESRSPYLMWIYDSLLVDLKAINRVISILKEVNEP